VNPTIHNELMSVADELRTALQIPDAPQAGAKHAYRLAILLGELRRWDAAAASMLLAARLDPTHKTAPAGMAECALRISRAGFTAPVRRLPQERLGGRISVIICSITPARLDAMRAQLSRLLDGESWELIHIDDARSLSEGYNRGIDRATGELLVLCHDDIEIMCDDFAAKLRTYLYHYDLIGVAGATRVTGPMWGWAGPPFVAGWVGHPLDEHRSMALVAGMFGPCVPGAQTLDGLFFAARRSLFDQIRYDADTFDGFHFYDLDLSYRAALGGARCGICLDISIYHESHGRYNEVFAKYAERFCNKFPQVCTQPVVSPSPLGFVMHDRNDLKPVHAWFSEWVGQAHAMVLARVAAGLQPARR
jgi:Glycosyltransferase like family